jgi:hypothetical protein
VSGEISIDSSSLSTKNAKRDKHVRSADFFDAERHPEVVVTVTDVKWAGGAALAPPLLAALSPISTAHEPPPAGRPSFTGCVQNLQLTGAQ